MNSNSALAVKNKGSFFSDALVIFALFNLTVARPLFELLSRNAEFFVYNRTQGWELIFLSLALVFFIPAVLVFIRWLISGVSQTAGLWFHGAMIAVFTIVFVLPAMNRRQWIDDFWTLSILGLLCSGFAAGYFRFAWLRSFFVYLWPAVILVPLLFFLSKGVRHFLRSNDYQIPKVTVNSKTPVIFIVFDELPVSSLMNEQRLIVERRFPNFARLSGSSTWYRNATTSAERTTEAIPALLSGSYPEAGRLPLLKDYPRTLFTLLAGSYTQNISEGVTNLSPPSNEKDTSVLLQAASLGSDLWLVYLHIVLPEFLASNLPPVTRSWGDFASNSTNTEAARRNNSSEPANQLNAFLRSIQPSKKPALHFLHVMLPHHPWHYLPNGKDYGARTFEGLILHNKTWQNDVPIVQRALHRHLLQVGFIDRWLGELILHLKKMNLYDPSLIVITSDHGIGFIPGDAARTVTARNTEDIIFVPLFIKAPQQKEGRIFDWNVEAIDVLPTIADILNVKIPWPVDGVSVAQSPPPPTRTRVVCDTGCQRKFQFDSKMLSGITPVKRRMEWFGPVSNDDPWKYFGPCSNFLNKQVPQNVIRAGGITCELRNRDLFSNFSLNSPVVPLMISGKVKFKESAAHRLKLAIAINRNFRATVISSPFTQSAESFDVIISESSFRAGANDVQIYWIPQCDDEPQLIPET